MFFGHMPRTDMLPYHRYDTPKSMGVPRVDLLLVSKGGRAWRPDGRLQKLRQRAPRDNSS